jgi:DNA repair protein RadC
MVIMTEKTLPLSVYETLKGQYQIPKEICIKSPHDVLQIEKIARLSMKATENFMIISLNSAGNVIKSHLITTGLLNHSLVHPREVYRQAIKDNALSVIAVHNHPSGNLIPSSSDIQVTKQLKESGEIIGISLLDHIIISRDGISSMRETGYL